MSIERDLEGWTIAFDLDGTLVDSAPDLIGTLNRMLVEEGHRVVPVSRRHGVDFARMRLPAVHPRPPCKGLRASARRPAAVLGLAPDTRVRGSACRRFTPRA